MANNDVILRSQPGCRCVKGAYFDFDCTALSFVQRRWLKSVHKPAASTDGWHVLPLGHKERPLSTTEDALSGHLNNINGMKVEKCHATKYIIPAKYNTLLFSFKIIGGLPLISKKCRSLIKTTNTLTQRNSSIILHKL